jgi:hypothetical protein
LRPVSPCSITPTLHYSSFLYLSIYIEQHGKIYRPFNCFHPGLLASCAALWKGLAVEERRKGERFKFALPVQLNDGISTTCDISTSGIFAVAETRPIFGGNWFKSFDAVN